MTPRHDALQHDVASSSANRHDNRRQVLAPKILHDMNESLNLPVSVALRACIFTKSVTIQSKSEANQRSKDDEPPPPSLLRRPHALRRHFLCHFVCDRGQLLRSCRRRRLRQSTLGSQYAHHEVTHTHHGGVIKETQRAISTQRPLYAAIDHPHPPRDELTLRQDRH